MNDLLESAKAIEMLVSAEIQGRFDHSLADKIRIMNRLRAAIQAEEARGTAYPNGMLIESYKAPPQDSGNPDDGRPRRSGSSAAGD